MFKKTILSLLSLAACCTMAAQDPQIAVPKIKTAPVIDGKLTDGEWQNAAAVTMFGSYNAKGALTTQQPQFYLAWDNQYIYVAMDSRQGSSNSVIAGTLLNDSLGIIGNDCVELMFAAGTGKEIYDMDFPSYYLAINALGTVWDAIFKPQRNECHNTWQSDVKTVSSVEGSRWVFEARIPIKSITLKKVQAGTKWRLNLCRTFYRYQWVALNPTGALNDCRVGADMVFTDENTPVVRTHSSGLAGARLRADVEFYNPSKKATSVQVDFSAECREQAGTKEFRTINSRQTYKLKPGERRRVNVGNGAKLSWSNKVKYSVKDEKGNPLQEIVRKVDIPAFTVPFMLAPVVNLIGTNVIYLHSYDLLEIAFDATAYLKKMGVSEGKFEAKIKVNLKGSKKPVIETSYKGFDTGKGKWSMPTKDLAEGHYDVEVEIFNQGKSVVKVSDWFEKRHFAWMKKHVLGENKTVPKPYEPLNAKDNVLKLWGRTYTFAPNGFLAQMTTQNRDYFAAPTDVILVQNGKEVKLSVSSAFRFTKVTPREVTGKAVLKGGGLTFEIVSIAEYDGFVRYQVTCKSGWFNKNLDRLRVKLQLNDRYCKFLSAAGNNEGVTIPAKVLAKGDGKIFDSKTDTYCVGMQPTFATVLWFGDHDVSFCYAADSDKGWVLHKDRPAVEAHRKGEVIDVYLNLIDCPTALNEPQMMEFAFQTGPTKPLPANWRGFQDVTNRYGKPIGTPSGPFYRQQIGGDGFTLHGGSHSMHPGTTPEQQKMSKDKIANLEKSAAPGQKAFVVGYQYWGHTVKGFPEARVFRSEWGITKNNWDTAATFDGSKWPRRTYGQNRDNYNFIGLSVCPSYVDFLTYSYDECLKHSNIYGFYDDVGYPKAVFNPRAGYGYIKDGKNYMSSGLWLYRKRWKEAAELNAKHNRLNLHGDSQHIHAHYLPAYHFIGTWAPCEQGYYNPFKEKDAFEFYGSMEQYAAMNPAKQTGQIPLVGLSSDKKKDYAGFAQDTRVMFMLTAMNDHSLGSFGRRDNRTIDRLGAARALFRHWENDVKFTGYWEKKDLCKISDPNVLLSAYTRKGQALLMLANQGDKTTTFTVTPDFKKLGVNSKGCVFTDAEYRKTIPFNGKNFTVTLKKHDIAMVLMGPKGAFKYTPYLNWDRLAGKDMNLKFDLEMPDGDKYFGKLYEKYYLSGGAYGYAQAIAKLPANGVKEVHAVVAGGMVTGLYWNGKPMFSAKMSNGKMQYTFGYGKPIRGKNTYKLKAAPDWSVGFYAIKMELKGNQIVVKISDDAKSWKQDAVITLPEGYAGNPAELQIGYGSMKGKNPRFRNIPKYFTPHPRYPSVTFFGNVGYTAK